MARLLSIMFEIDARPGITAAELGESVGVSPRTVYRDIDALQQAGIPVFGTSGPNGGLRLVDGYRSRAATLRVEEAAALLTGVVPGVAEQLGLQSDLDRARRKVRLQSGGHHQKRQVLVDPVGWYRSPDEVPHLVTVAEALRTSTVVVMRYSRWEQPREVTRTIEPLGLVLKSGAWYVMARSRRQLRAYRVNQIRSARLSTRQFKPDPTFDLEASWAAFVVDFRQRLKTFEAHVRISRVARDSIRSDANPALVEALNNVITLVCEHTNDVEAYLPFESVERAAAELLRLGTEIEVFAPAALRQHMASVTAALAERYR